MDKVKVLARCRKKYGHGIEDIFIDINRIPKDKQQYWMFVSEFKTYLPELEKRYSMIGGVQ